MTVESFFSEGMLRNVAGWTLAAAKLIALASLAYLAASRIRRRGPLLWRPKVPPTGFGLPLLGFALGMVPTLAGGQERPLPVPGRSPRHAPPSPWSRADGLPPPRPSAPAGGRSQGLEGGLSNPSRHPAVHGRGSLAPRPRLLFPRVWDRADPKRSMESRPSEGVTSTPRFTYRSHRPGDDAEGPRRRPGVFPKASGHAQPHLRSGTESWHRVQAGETLWSIAAETLDTRDMRRIARYWPRIHKANRSVIGPNPDLIRPGQRLRLPSEGESH